MKDIILIVIICLVAVLVYTRFIQRITSNLSREGQNRLAQIADYQSARYVALSQMLDQVEYYDEKRYTALRKLFKDRCTINSISNIKDQDRLFNRIYGEINEMVLQFEDLAHTDAYAKLVTTAHSYKTHGESIQQEYNQIVTKLNRTIEMKPNQLIVSLADMRKMACF